MTHGDKMPNKIWAYETRSEAVKSWSKIEPARLIAQGLGMKKYIRADLKKCPMGADCDLTIAYMKGVEDGKDLNEWQPIETLPKKGKASKKFDLWVIRDNGKEYRATDCYFHRKANAIIGINHVRDTATHWRHEPQPPKGEE